MSFLFSTNPYILFDYKKDKKIAVPVFWQHIFPQKNSLALQSKDFSLSLINPASSESSKNSSHNALFLGYASPLSLLKITYHDFTKRIDLKIVNHYKPKNCFQENFYELNFSPKFPKLHSKLPENLTPLIVILTLTSSELRIKITSKIKSNKCSEYQSWLLNPFSKKNTAEPLLKNRSSKASPLKGTQNSLLLFQ